MTPLIKRTQLSALACLLLLPSVASADLFSPRINADSLGRAGAGVAFIGGAAAVLENPAGLPVRYTDEIEGNFEISIGISEAPELYNPNQQADEFFSATNTTNFSGGLHLGTKNIGLALSAGYFGGELRNIPSDKKDETYYQDKNPIQNQYFGIGLGYNLLPEEWSTDLKLGVSYIFMPKTGGALVAGVQAKLIDTQRHSFSLGASNRSFSYSDKEELRSKYANYEKASMDLPSQTSLGASWLIKGWKNSLHLAVDVKETDYSQVLHLQDLGATQGGRIYDSNGADVFSWSSALHNLDIYKSQHATLSWLTSEYGSWSLGYSQGNSETAGLDSTTLGISAHSREWGLGFQLQKLEKGDKSQTINSLVFTYNPRFDS